MRTPQPSTAAGNLVGAQLCRVRDLLMEELLHRVVGEAVARFGHLRGVADGEKARVLAGAVVRQRPRLAPLLETALEIVLGRRRPREQAGDGLELLRRGAMRRAGDRELDLRDVVPLTGKRERLDRLRGGAVEGDEARVAGAVDDAPVLDGDGVDSVDASITGPRLTVT